MNCHVENTLQSINMRMHFLNSCRISGHFDTKFTTIAQIEKILQESKDPEIDNILNLEQVYFLVTHVIWPYKPLLRYLTSPCKSIFKKKPYSLVAEYQKEA